MTVSERIDEAFKTDGSIIPFIREELGDYVADYLDEGIKRGAVEDTPLLVDVAAGLLAEWSFNGTGRTDILMGSRLFPSGDDESF